jgi:hypothetical protein
MSREDKQDWAEAYDKEYRRFMERKAFKVVCPEKGIRIHDTLTRLEYKEDHLQVGGESNGSNGSNELGSNEFMQ